MSIGIGIVGHGFIGHIHESMLTELEGYQVIGICDIDSDKLKDVKDGILTYQTAEEMYKNPAIQTVIIAANNNQHKNLVIQAAKSGKNIICEKPVGLTVAELDEMYKVTQECGVKFTVHQQRRFDQDFRTIKEIYDKKLLGNVYTIKSSLYGYNGNMHDWHIFKKEGGGMLYDWGVHLIDQILYMVEGKIVSVYADVRNVINKEVDDYFKILLKFENGVMAEIELGTYYLKDKEGWFTRHWFIGGNEGSAYVDGFDPQGKIVKTSHLLENPKNGKSLGAEGPTRSFGTPEEGLILTEDLPVQRTEHKDYFVNYRNAMEGKEEFLVKIPEARRVLRLMEVIRESAETGKAIKFE